VRATKISGDTNKEGNQAIRTEVSDTLTDKILYIMKEAKHICSKKQKCISKVRNNLAICSIALS